MNPISLHNIHKVAFIESMGNYIQIHWKHSTKLVARYTLKKIETEFPDSQLIRIHNRYIINISSIDSLENNRSIVKIKAEETLFHIPVSRKYLKTFSTRYGSLKKGSEIIYTQNDPGYPF